MVNFKKAIDDCLRTIFILLLKYVFCVLTRFFIRYFLKKIILNQKIQGLLGVNKGVLMFLLGLCINENVIV